jgi:hypothetical protein
LEDAERRRLRYHLLRLTLAGLTTEDVEDLRILGRVAFQEFEAEVREQTAKIKQRAGTSSLAFAIADIVEHAAVERTADLRGPGGLKAVMLGAVLGAYTSLGIVAESDLGNIAGIEKSTVATLGAIGGAIATWTSTIVRDNINDLGWAAYTRTDDDRPGNLNTEANGGAAKEG